jgi:DUF971 family protein
MTVTVLDGRKHRLEARLQVGVRGTVGDGVEQRIPWRTLREHCPCATCRQKRSDPAPPPLFNILKPEEANPVQATAMSPIGNYAYQIDFSDGHKTGIFSLELLRELGEEQERYKLEDRR